MHIIKILMDVESLTLGEIAKELEKQGFKMALPAVVKHVKQLEDAGILRSSSGRLLSEPDARKTIFRLESKERIKEVMKHLNEIYNLLEIESMLAETERLALKIQTMKCKASEIEKFQHLLEKCGLEEVNKHLTESEKKKIELWKTLLKHLNFS